MEVRSQSRSQQGAMILKPVEGEGWERDQIEHPGARRMPKRRLPAGPRLPV